MTEEKLKTSARTALGRYLTDHNMRHTPERYAILDEVLQYNDHFTIDDLWAKMANSSFTVSRATVYSSIKLLTEVGIVRRHTFEGRRSQYEKVSPTVGNHQHLICTECGRVKEVRDIDLFNQLNSRRYSAFNPAYTTIYVYGICSACVRKNKRKNKEKTNPKK